MTDNLGEASGRKCLLHKQNLDFRTVPSQVMRQLLHMRLPDWPLPVNLGLWAGLHSAVLAAMMCMN
jgi:hypothetical protein